MITHYISTSSIQKNPKGAFTDKKNPVQIVMNNNEPQGLIISWDIAENLLKNNFLSQKESLSSWEQEAIERGLNDVENNKISTQKDLENTLKRLDS